MVPSWVPSAPDSDESVTEDEAQADTESPVPDTENPTILLAPAGRFRPTRVNLGGFAASGNGNKLKRAVGHYVKSGYGGRATAVKRFGGTARLAGALYSALSPGAGDRATPARDALEAAVQAGGPPEKIVTALVEAIRPIDGTQDAEADRKAIADALAELMTRFPDADLLSLTAEQLNMLISRFVAIDVFNRFFLDVGKTIIERAPSVVTGLSRLREAREYIRETVIAAFNKIVSASAALNRSRMVSLVSSALRDAFEVFEGYTQ